MTDYGISLDSILGDPGGGAPAPLPDPPPPDRPRQSAPPQEEYPWTPEEDELFRRGAFKRSWAGISRREWNASPNNAGGTPCRTCGYKWHPWDIIKVADGQCFNCWLIETKPEAVEKFWRNMSKGERHGETAPPAPVLKKLTDKGEKKS